MLHGLAASFALNCFLFVLISFLTKPQPLEQIEAFHGVLHKKL